MKTYSLTHLSTAVLLRNTDELVAHDRENTADLLAHLAEVESRKEYVRAGYDSMSAWAVHRLRMSEDAVYKRLQAAHAARDYPILFPALAEGTAPERRLPAGATPECRECNGPGRGRDPQDQRKGQALACPALSPHGATTAGGGRIVTSRR